MRVVHPSPASSAVQPLAPSGFCGPAGQPFGHASATTAIGSLALPPPASPPPATVAVLVTVAAALLATATVTVIGGYAAPGANTSARVQRVPVHVQPGPAAATGPAPTPGLLISADSPAGKVSLT